MDPVITRPWFLLFPTLTNTSMRLLPSLLRGFCIVERVIFTVKVRGEYSRKYHLDSSTFAVEPS